MKAFPKTLLKWYETNKRDLPWRNTRNPYQIWLSEVILQQTRVDQGMAYYLRFCELFPDIHALAGASEDAVLKAWQGLGYYSRARNLHATSKIISELHQGQFPSSSVELLKLKGIGPYTAAAIASFAWNEKIPVVDGNVMRVISRIFGIEDPVDSSAGRKKIDDLLYALIDPKNPGQFNQAMMEFGAIQCTPTNPDCTSCPFKSSCFAFEHQLIDSLPLKSQKTKVRNLWLTYFYVTWKNHIYIHKRVQKGIWQGLFDFPSIESEKKIQPAIVLETFMKDLPKSRSTAVHMPKQEYVHLLSHRKIHALFYRIELGSEWKNLPPHVSKIPLSDLPAYGIPRLVERYLQDMEK